MRYLMLAAFALAAIGCGSDSDQTSKKSSDEAALSDSTPSDANTAVLSIEGPGGTVALGDSLEQAKIAFPPPEEAILFDNSLSFAIFGVDGWAWADESGNTAFEVGLEGDKIIAIARTELTGPVSEQAIEAQRSAHGSPTAEAVSENAAMLIWASGDNARFFIVMINEIPFFGAGEMTVIGPKEKLKLLNYHYDQPNLFVDQIDAMMAIDFDTPFGESLDGD